MDLPAPAIVADLLSSGIGHELLPLLKAERAPSSRLHLPAHAVPDMANGMLFARDRLSAPLNRHMTIWWRHSEGFSPEPRTWIAHQGRLLKRMDAWQQHRGIPTAKIAVREIGNIKLWHTHVLFSMPAEHVDAFLGFIVECGKFSHCDDPANRPVVITGGWPEDRDGAVSPAQQAGLIRYLAKGMSPKQKIGGKVVADALDIKPKANSAPLEGKPYSLHRSISRKARADAGWIDTVDLASLRAALPTGEDTRRQRRNQVGASRHV